MDELSHLLRDSYNDIWINGRFLALKTYPHSCSFLYSLNGRFVELIYDKERSAIVCVSYVETADLQKYLDDIDLSALAGDEHRTG